jgi:hypothetical protein
MNWAFRSNFTVALVAVAAVAMSNGQAAYAAPAKKNTVAAPAGKTAVSITRSTDMLYFGSSASVEINGVKVASLGRGETYAADIAPGPTVVSVSSWSSPGVSSYSFSAQRGKTYQLAVKPRGGNFAAAMVGGLVGQAVEGHGQFEIAPTP